MDKPLDERLREGKISDKELLELSLQILMRPKHLRDDIEIEILQKQMDKIEFFSKIKQQEGPDLIAEICRHLEYETIEKGKVLFEEGKPFINENNFLGSIGTKFYVILVGAVEVYIKGTKKNEQGEDVHEQMKVAEVTAGRSFGELAVMDDILKPRKATIISKDRCHFAILSRTAFQSCLGHIKREMILQMECLTANPLFARQKWSNRAIEQWLKLFEDHLHLKRNHVIYKEGDPVDDIYFVKSGEVVCLKKIQIKQADDLKKDIILDEKNQVFQLEKDVLHKSIEIAVWREGMIFGEEEAAQVYKMEKVLDKEREKIKRDLKDKFDVERRKAEENYNYKSSIEVPDNPDEDDEIIEKLIQKRIEQICRDSVRRETTVTILSYKAELWQIPRKMFFYHLEPNLAAWRHLETAIDMKKKRRIERIAEFQNLAQKNFNFIAKQSPSIVKKDITTQIKKKKLIRHEKHNKVIFKEDPNFNNVIKSLKDIKEAKRRHAESLAMDETENDFPLAEMRQKSAFTLRPDSPVQKTKMLTEGNENISPGPHVRSKTVWIKNSNDLEHIHPRNFGLLKKTTTQQFESPVLYGSFMNHLDDSHYSRYLKKKSKLYAQEQQRKMPTEPDRPSIRESLVTGPPEILENNTYVMDNPLKGLNYASNLVYYDKNGPRGPANRVTSHEQGTEVLDAERFIRGRLKMKTQMVKKMSEQSPFTKSGSIDDPFFTVDELKESEENFVHNFKQLSRMDQLYDIRMAIKYGPQDPKKADSKRYLDYKRPSTSFKMRTEETRMSTEEEQFHVIHELHSPDKPKKSRQEDELPPLLKESKSRQSPPGSLSPSKTVAFLDRKETSPAPAAQTENDASLIMYPTRSQTPQPASRRATVRALLQNPEQIKDNTLIIREHSRERSRGNTKNILTETSGANADILSTSFSVFPSKPKKAASKSPIINRDQRDYSNQVVRMVAKAGKLVPHVLHNAPKFTPHHRVLLQGESSFLNRKPVVDKAKVILDRLGRSPNLPAHIKKKLTSKKLLVTGKKESLLEINTKKQQKSKNDL